MSVDDEGGWQASYRGSVAEDKGTGGHCTVNIANDLVEGVPLIYVHT